MTSGYDQYIENINVTIAQLESEIRSFNYHIVNTADTRVRASLEREVSHLVVNQSDLILKKAQIERALGLWNNIQGANLGDTLIITSQR